MFSNFEFFEFFELSFFACVFCFEIIDAHSTSHFTRHVVLSDFELSSFVFVSDLLSLHDFPFLLSFNFHFNIFANYFSISPVRISVFIVDLMSCNSYLSFNFIRKSYRTVKDTSLSFYFILLYCRYVVVIVIPSLSN